MSISRIDHSLGRGSASPCRAERKPVNVTGTVASQMITPLATTHGVDPNASAMRPAKAIASPTYPTRSAQTAILQDPFCCSSSRSSTPGIVRAPPFSERVTLVLRGGNCLRQGPLASAPAGPKRLAPLSGCTGARANTRSCIIVRSGSLRLAGRLAMPEGLQVDLLPRREGTFRNGWQPTADALLTMEGRRQLVAVGGNGFRLFSRIRRLADLPLIATGCNPGAP